MTCSKFHHLISSDLDGELRPSERVVLKEHLNQCDHCSRFARDLDRQSAALRALRESNAERSVEMQAAVIDNLQIEARREAIRIQRRAEYRLNWQVRLFSRSFAAVASLLLFLMLVTSVLKPAQRAFGLALAAAEAVAPDEAGDEEIAQLKDLLLPPPPSPRPILDPRGTLIGFSKRVPDEEFAVIAWVDVDGTASVRQVIEAPQKPEVIAQLSTALTRQANFKPAYRRGRYTPANAILMFSQITIIG